MRDRYRQIVELSRDCIKEIDLDGCIQAVNANGLGLLAARSEQVIGHYWPSLWPRSEQARVKDALAATARGEHCSFEAECVNFAGERQTWRVSTSPLHGPGGEIEAILAVSSDITDRRRIETALHTLALGLRSELTAAGTRLSRARQREDALSDALATSRLQIANEAEEHLRLESERDIAVAAQRVAEAIAQQAQKGEAIGQLLAGVTHDLGNVLQTALSAIGLILQRDQIAAQDRQLLNVAEHALEHGAIMSHRLLGFARVHPYAPEPTDLAGLVAALDPLLRQALDPGIRLEVDTGTGEQRVRVDRHTFERALMNLVINARDACAGHGTIRIALSRTSVSAADADLQRPPGEYVTLAVQDDGEGMSPEVRERLFEAYFTTKPDGKGTGLGLAQVYGAIRQAGGFIEVVSAPGQGACFTLALPRID